MQGSTDNDVTISKLANCELLNRLFGANVSIKIMINNIN